MKKKIYIVPHTHWDREWMFSEQTGNVLLNQVLNELLKIVEDDEEFKMVLDGQASLIDDYLKWNPSQKTKIIAVLKKGQISLGPWYSQPDVFSALGETTLRNLEVGMATIKNLGLKPMMSAYLPDTFGFNKNLPQIFVKKGLKHFIHWRGLNRQQIKNYPIYKWEGIDGSQIIATNYFKGYYYLGMYYPYRGVTLKNFDQKVNLFLEKTRETIKKIFIDQNRGNSILLPLGGDQAPGEHGITKFIIALNKAQTEYQWVVINDFEKFFHEYRNDLTIPVLKGDLKTPIASKIHRTIASARYDIKKLFRTNEIALYYQLEPLEILYKNLDPLYDFEEYKLNQIMKPLLKLQAHDSLGGCNTDITNDDIVAKSKQILRRTKSLIDLITYKIAQKAGFRDQKNVLNVFNQMPNIRSFVKVTTIYSSKKEINLAKNGIILKTLKSQQIGFHKLVYQHQVLLKAENLKPFSYRFIDIEKTNAPVNEQKGVNDHIEIMGDYVEINLKGQKAKFSYFGTEDVGDNYDYSPGSEKVTIKQNHTLLKGLKINEVYLYELKTTFSLNDQIQEFLLTIIIDQEKIDLKITTINQYVAKKIAIRFIGNENIYKSQHLVISKFNQLDERANWKADMLEYPALVDYADGLVQMRGQNGYNIFLKGTNELFKTKNGVEITLFRTQKYVSREDLPWRPSKASGVSYEEISDSSQLQRKLQFDFRITFNNDYIQALNEWYFEPIYHYKNSVHLTAHRMNKFEINDIVKSDQKAIPFPIIDTHKLLISKLKLDNNQIAARLVNMENKKLKSIVKINKTSELSFKQYEFKEI